jgi:hypothetical protein
MLCATEMHFLWQNKGTQQKNNLLSVRVHVTSNYKQSCDLYFRFYLILGKTPTCSDRKHRRCTTCSL